MSEMRDTHSDDVQRRSPVIFEVMPLHRDLVKVNKYLIYAVICLMAVVFLMGFFLLPSHNARDTAYKSIAFETAYKAKTNPVLSAEIDVLKAQVVGLVSGSIESKLRTLEQSVKSGSIAYSLGTIEELKNDVKVLRNYSGPVEVKADLPSEQVLKEISQLKDLIYFTLASCSLMLAAIVGVWFKNRKRLPYKAMRQGFLGKP
ncbi:MAG: hypothetical protein CVV13_03525 [Gammaproteobacteria bacterium HGW-Gammaproteobacteria-3]|nr:MAG: hypothetical protein CVV13_03525 [Gammaproteobacteria bacterium HGW-Gammaproteobacteria-3]